MMDFEGIIDLISVQVVWQLIMHGHCSFRSKTTTQNFCRNEYNVTGASKSKIVYLRIQNMVLWVVSGQFHSVL